MTTLAARADSSDVLEDLVTRSAAILEAAGFQCFPLGDRLTPWQLEAACPWGHALVHVFRGEEPSRLGVDPFSLPKAWSPRTRRFQHQWGDGPLPAVREL